MQTDDRRAELARSLRLVQVRAHLLKLRADLAPVLPPGMQGGVLSEVERGLRDLDHELDDLDGELRATAAARGLAPTEQP